MSLVKCIRKAGKYLSEQDREAIFATHAGYLEQGEKVKDAARKAIQEQIAAVREEMKAPKQATAKPAGEQSLDQQLADRLAVEQPELQVVLPGSDERMTVSQAMARIAETQKQDAQWADLVKVATECALGAA